MRHGVYCLYVIIIMVDGVVERIKASVVTYVAHRRRFDADRGQHFSLAKSWCPKKNATIPHPGMADTYGCPLKNLPNPKNTRV